MTPARLKTIAIAAFAFGMGGIIGAADAAPGEERPKQLIIVADLQENLAVSNSGYISRRTTQLLVDYARDLDLSFGDTVKLRVANGTSYSDKPESWDRTVTLAYHGAKPADLEGFLKGRLGELPSLPKAEDSGLLWTLDEIASETDCEGFDTYLVVIGTGVHLTQETDGRIAMQGLPGRPFVGCREVFWLGLVADGKAMTIAKKDAIEDVFEQLGQSMGMKDVRIAR